MAQPFHFTGRLAAALTLCFLLATVAHAGPEASGADPQAMSVTHSVSAMARDHWQAISQGDVTTLESISKLACGPANG